MADHNQEILDIVDINNNIIGQASRLEIHKKNLMHRSAHIFVTHGNYVFLQLRSCHKKQFPNKWDTSAAGHVDSGETYIQAAIRELKEELAIDLNTDHLSTKLEEVTDIPASKDNGFEFVKIFCINFTNKPEISLAIDEITCGGWFETNHISYWVKKHPEHFAGGFNEIWHNFHIHQYRSQV